MPTSHEKSRGVPRLLLSRPAHRQAQAAGQLSIQSGLWKKNTLVPRAGTVTWVEEPMTARVSPSIRLQPLAPLSCQSLQVRVTAESEALTRVTISADWFRMIGMAVAAIGFRDTLLT